MKSNLVKALAIAAFVASPLVAHADVAISVGFAPPPLPVYAQPPIPGEGYMWTPGYWAWSYDNNDYYWVPGMWVQAPFVGALWTPGYWGWVGGSYLWHGGYWGTHIGYYGGINYGFGYVGVGYQGGYWNHGAWTYNHAVNNFGNVHVANVYNSTVNNYNNSTHVSYNGGAGGVNMAPTREQKAQNFTHYAPTGSQVNQEQLSRGQPQMHTAYNGGQPTTGAAPNANRYNAPPANTAPPRTTMNQAQPTSGGANQQYAQRSQPMQNYRTPSSEPVRQVSMSPQARYMARQPSYSQSMMHQSAPSMSHNMSHTMSQARPQHSSHFR